MESEESDVMKYALNLDSDGRVLSASVVFEMDSEDKYDNVVDELPEGNIVDYKYAEGEYVYDPLPKEEETEQPSQLDILESQIIYTAMMTNTLLGV